jgi:hypothetical protein
MPDFFAGHIADQATSRAKKSGIKSLPKPFELGNRREQLILACNQLKFGSNMSRGTADTGKHHDQLWGCSLFKS